MTAEGVAQPSRRARKKERTRREIYQAAMTLFADGGFDQVTVEQICQAADVARGTFFLHFPTKAALLFEFNRATTADFAASLSEPRESATRELERLIDRLAEGWLERAEVMTAMLREFLGTPAAWADAETSGQDLPELIEDIVRRGQQRGELRESIAPRLAAAVFLSTSLAILSGHVFQPGEVTPEGARDQMIEIMLRGLVAP